MSGDPWFVDASAFLKLFVTEPESAELRRWVSGHRLASSDLLRTEARRAIAVGHAQRRVTYYFADRQRIVLLTVFRKQRPRERTEIRRARRAMRRCIAEGQNTEEGH